MGNSSSKVHGFLASHSKKDAKSQGHPYLTTLCQDTSPYETNKDVPWRYNYSIMMANREEVKLKKEEVSANITEGQEFSKSVVGFWSNSALYDEQISTRHGKIWCTRCGKSKHGSLWLADDDVAKRERHARIQIETCPIR
ncbi:uncharacterized protein G2W53_033506 [Senna tora]|uniref:Uncharacterized protein n=1 Tax=Senna tora TaxID=362788 RepID=A0A834SYE0_9FABA|nr:uncharacterized protein G2W53_033506 [Senna tora]